MPRLVIEMRSLANGKQGRVIKFSYDIHPGTIEHYTSPSYIYSYLTGERSNTRLKSIIPVTGTNSYIFGEDRESKSVYYLVISKKTHKPVAEIGISW